MAARVLAQVLLVGGQVVGRAAMQAYRQALASESAPAPTWLRLVAKSGPLMSLSPFADGKAGGVSAALRNTMPSAEARLVLNVEEGASAEAIMKVPLVSQEAIVLTRVLCAAEF